MNIKEMITKGELSELKLRKEKAEAAIVRFKETINRIDRRVKELKWSLK